MRNVFGLVLLIVLGALLGVARAAELRHFPANGSLTFQFHDDIDSPIYSWPRTLLSYPVDFSGAHISSAELQLVNSSTGKAEPMQLSGVKTDSKGELLFAYVNFFSDLPPGDSRSFELKHVSGAGHSGEAIHVNQTDNAIEIDAGSLGVRIPRGGDVGANESVAGPILAINSGNGWVGESHIVSPNDPVQHIEVQQTDLGPIFCAYRITYLFAKGGSYIATVKVPLDYPFVEFSEEMNGISAEEKAFVEMRWAGFDPKERLPAGNWLCPDKGGLGIDEAVVTPGIIEEPHWWPADRVEDPSKEMIYQLAANSGNGVREATPVMSFWETRPGGQELSVFVADAKTWNDGQYMIWQPSTRLRVHFRYEDGQLFWTWPLVDGTRATEISLHDTREDEAAVEAVRKIYLTEGYGHKGAYEGAWSPKIAAFNIRYAQLLRSWYGYLSLNNVKDWVLTYPKDAKRSSALPGPGETKAADYVKNAEQLKNAVFYSPLMLYPLGGNLGVMDISHRIIRPIVEGYGRVAGELGPAERKRIDAMLLLSAYLNATDEFAPLRICMTGCPNMSADGFCVPSEIAMLYPDHPMGAEWRDQFEKALQLCGCYYTRPAVAAWDALGGRWAESLSTYNWGYLVPTEAAQTASFAVDGRNRMANGWLAERGEWLVDELSAPIYNPVPYWRQEIWTMKQPPPLDAKWHAGMPLSGEFGFERQYPPHGAHGSGTGIVIPPSMLVMAGYLRDYDPLTAEHMIWAYDQVTSKDPGEFVRTPWINGDLDRLAGATGTNPHLKSCKYTGHGIVFRAGVDTREELSIHLDQVDAGPNYRWGNIQEGSSGVLYYYAAGQCWSGHERENTGDHTNDDSTGFTTYAVVHNGEYRGIGENVLDQPLYDLGVAQFGSIAARTGPGAYSWPEYKSRSILLVGTDYMIVTDDAEGEGRFSWFNAGDLPFPKIVYLKPLAARQDHWTEVRTTTSRGLLRDAVGPSIVLVTHKKDQVEMEGMKYKSVYPFEWAGAREYSWDLPTGQQAVAGVWRVKAPESHDIVFRDTSPISYSKEHQAFAGTAGVIRDFDDGHIAMAILQGSKISAGGITLEVPSSDQVGIGATFKPGDSRVAGRFFAPKASRLTVNGVPNVSIYIDGEKQNVATSGSSMIVSLPAGNHAWECTAGLPVPIAPTILRTENIAGGGKVFFTTVAGADQYHLEISTDGAKTWQAAGGGSASPLTISKAFNGTKIHVRVIAANAQQQSSPTDEYPLYVSDKAPDTPDGLDLQLNTDRVTATWGQVLGVSKYNLYRRKKGESDWQLVYSGLDPEFTDNAPGVIPPAALPGAADNLNLPSCTMYEYAVASANANGESAKSFIADTDPTSWRNWWPAGQERRFKRQTAFWLPPYVPADMTPPVHYPN